MVERWTSNDGRVEIWSSGPHLRARVPFDALDPENSETREVLLYPRTTERGNAWIGKAWEGDDLDVLVVVRDSDEVIAARTITRPHAAGGELDPRGIEVDYRCARVIEREPRESAAMVELRRLAGVTEGVSR